MPGFMGTGRRMHLVVPAEEHGFQCSMATFGEFPAACVWKECSSFLSD